MDRAIRQSILAILLSTQTLDMYADVIIVAPMPLASESVDGLVVRDRLSPEEFISVKSVGELEMKRLESELGLAGAVQYPPNSPSPFGFAYEGRVVDYIVGARNGVWANPAQHDQVVFQAYSRDGKRIIPATVAISGLFVMTLIHQYDGPEDFVSAFSDRHIEAQVPFGSVAHRDIIYSLVDPGNDFGLRTGANPPALVSHGAEGRILSFIMDGPPSQDDVIRSGGWDRHSSNRVSQSSASDLVPNSGRGSVIGQLSSRSLLVSAARARQFPAFDDSLEELSMSALGMLCSLVLIDPAFVSSANRGAAIRANNLGINCMEAVTGPARQTMSATSDGYFGGFLPGTSTAFSMTDDNIASVTLDVMLSEDVFTLYLGAVDDISLDAYGVSVFPHYENQIEGYPEDTVRGLIDISSGNREWASNKTRVKAERVLTRMVKPDRMSAHTDPSYYRAERRYFEKDIWEYAVAPSPVFGPVSPFVHGKNQELLRRQDWALEFFCKLGWGSVEDRRRDASSALSVVGNTAWVKMRLDFDPTDEMALRNRNEEREEYFSGILGRLLIRSPNEDQEKETLPDWINSKFAEDLSNAYEELRPWLISEYEKARESASSCSG